MSHLLIDHYVADLRRGLPAGLAAEAADGLIETYESHLSRSASSEQAARAALAEFGEPALVIREFTRQAPGRRISRALLATGPAVGACWAAALIAAHAWAWPAAGTVRLAAGPALLLMTGILAAAATSEHSYRRTRLTALACPALILLDVTAITAAVLTAPALTWPLALAIAASLTRITFTLWSLPRLAPR